MLLPIYVYFLGMPQLAFVAPVSLVYTLAIAFLMVSRLPVFSGKRVGKRVAPEMVLPVFVVVVLAFALLIAYPWAVLTLGTVAYICSLPFGWLSYREQERKAAGVVAQPAVVNATGGGNQGTACDATSRFETDPTNANANPTWIDQTGGDTVWATTVTNTAVYIGGHNRWNNNRAKCTPRARHDATRQIK